MAGLPESRGTPPSRRLSRVCPRDFHIPPGNLPSPYSVGNRADEKAWVGPQPNGAPLWRKVTVTVPSGRTELAENPIPSLVSQVQRSRDSQSALPVPFPCATLSTGS